ncbi:XRE family transcriptional regulator [Cryobacterium sp. Sr8]|uniref:helix-turn-helix domain-containing protein n=1 Tax=Cryobacterium sp. Sr8 TaxID=1259203 RepID=UPI00106C8B42|nr:helix-turn-helix transcriptional regulator [Cryobacterium sp. Sr8]TFD74893.1 XRE family transcriptional regulator [Cryobacterium sp. Sr8]
MSPRPARVAPAELCVDWPTTASDDPVAEVARLLTLNLRRAIGDRSVREVARITAVDRATIGAVLNGLSWPDIVTLAKLESGLGCSLWPGITG